ncbi:transcriptional repressor [Scheffersomyces stipitis CBS 6054]|uniref:Transcriptional repressor n=1 Tax=Scheffersomyces stipitis (strain ATCC 58785 / CBS 6054 / NBRC 10063 / NRRL Y-11545) TaxID=322104 RepID=A3LWK5_PICST|nr:transcriptional repressor [Scheffersomyces stipitis CBS 6054]ABN66986.2 transcriptional repressor [Scheffersomyces stipitis CBS 6054]KAG2734870.1 hypothetical protein G9P44_002876 [Scheffersomyces stipitis]
MLCSQPHTKSTLSKAVDGQPLPSFTELLTSIPLPSEFKGKSSGSSASSTASSSPYTYYSPVMQRAASPLQATVVTTPPEYYPISQQSVIIHPHPVSANNYQYLQYQYQPYDGRSVMTRPLLSPPIMEGTTIPTPPSSSNSHRTIRSSSPNSTASSPGDATSPSAHMALISEPIAVLTADPKRRHICKVCARSFTTSGHLARHNRIHTGERKHVCPWPTCDARFARQDNCMQHYKTHTNGKNKRSKLSFKTKLNPKSFT